jgi:hypothetical protein
VKRQPTNRIVAYGYVGRYIDGTLGWGVPTFLTDYKGISPDKPLDYFLTDIATGDEVFEVCRITIEVLPGKRTRTANELRSKR